MSLHLSSVSKAVVPIFWGLHCITLEGAPKGLAQSGRKEQTMNLQTPIPAAVNLKSTGYQQEFPS